MGGTFQGAEVQLIATRGGWEPHKDRQPGKITLMRGLGRLLAMLATMTVFLPTLQRFCTAGPPRSYQERSGEILMYEEMPGEILLIWLEANGPLSHYR